MQYTWIISLCKAQDLGVDPRSVPQEHYLSLCKAQDLGEDPRSVPQEPRGV